MTTAAQTGSAAIQGDLWGARALDWADVMEPAGAPVAAAALDIVGAGPGIALLDVGCGAGACLAVAAARGARVSGIDAAQTLVAIARERVRGADVRTGEMQDLPWPDGSFDAVTAVNAVQYAADPVAALREARRVARPGAPVAVAAWGEPERCEAAPYIAALGSLLPPPTPGAPGPFALSAPGALEELAAAAGLSSRGARDVDCVWEFPDEPTALRAALSAGPAVRAIRHAGEAAVNAAVLAAMAPYRTAAGGYRLENRFRVVAAGA